jgi:hypothetical protein
MSTPREDDYGLDILELDWWAGRRGLDPIDTWAIELLIR